MNSPEFKSAYEKARRGLVQQSMNQLQQAAAKAVEVMIEIMNDKATAPSARLAAAKSVLEYSVQTTQIEELNKQVRELEFLIKYEREIK